MEPDVTEMIRRTLAKSGLRKSAVKAKRCFARRGKIELLVRPEITLEKKDKKRRRHRRSKPFRTKVP